MPQFNELLLYYAATVLDISRLDSASYKFPFHIIAAAILTRVSINLSRLQSDLTFSCLTSSSWIR